MRHEQVREQLSFYVEETLDPAMMTAVDNHLRECDACAGELDEMRSVYALLGSPSMDVEPPGNFHDNVMRKVRLAERERNRSPRGFLNRLGWGWTSAGAAAVSLAILAIVLAVGPLHDGLSAGFGLRNRPTPSVPVASGRLSVIFSPVAPELGREWDIVVRAFAPEDGEWILYGRPSIGLAIPSPYATEPDGSQEIWSGRLGAGGATDTTVRLLPTMTGSVAELNVRLQKIGGGVAADQTVFLWVGSDAPDADAGAEEEWDATLRTSLRDFTRAHRRPISAPTSALNKPIRLDPEEGRINKARRSMEVLQTIAGEAGLSVRPSGGGYVLAP